MVGKGNTPLRDGMHCNDTSMERYGREEARGEGKRTRERGRGRTREKEGGRLGGKGVKGGSVGGREGETVTVVTKEQKRREQTGAANHPERDLTTRGGETLGEGIGGRERGGRLQGGETM